MRTPGVRAGLSWPYQGTAAFSSAAAGRIEERVHPSPAESRHPDPVGHCGRVLLDPVHDGIEVGHDPGIGDGVHDLAHRVEIGQVLHAPFPGIGLEGDGQESLPGKSACHVLDVLVHPEDLRDDQYCRIFSGGGRPHRVDRHRKPARGHRAVRGGETLRGGGDHLSGHGGCRDGKAREADTGHTHP